MPIKIDISRNFQRVLSRNTIAEVRKEFSKKGPIKVKQAIIKDVIKGISPVKGGGKFKKYSKSYKEVIAGKAMYRTWGGKVIRMPIKDVDFHSKSSPTKQKSPVNLRHTGEFHRALKAFTKGGFFKTFKLHIAWEHFLADIHNRRGASKSKVVRRLLPTNQNEKFNRKIMTILVDELKKSVNIVAKKLS